MKKYKPSQTTAPTSAIGFSEASAEELRVLISVMEAKAPVSEEEIIRKAKVSPARAKGAVAFWEAEGLISAESEEQISEEFEERVRAGEIEEIPSKEVAESIRDEGIADLFAECAEMIEKPVLTTGEIKIITALVTQYALTPDYILTLAAYLKSKGKLTVHKLRDRAISLAAKGTDTTQALEIYIKDNENRTADEMEFRRLLGIYDRKLSAAEKQLFEKWANLFGYSSTIVGEAYNLSVMNTGKLSLPYMDKVLSAWHGEGLKTLEECRAHTAAKSAEYSKAAKSPRPRSKTEAEKPKYGDFDINDAFSRALKRSYDDN